MKRILNFPTLMLLFVAALFMTSCEDEPGGGSGNDTAAALSLSSASDLTLSPAEEFTITIAADKGTNEMNAVTVYEDGIKVPADRLKFNGTEAAANPALLFGTDRESLDWTVSIIAQATAGTTANFEVEIRDDQMLTSSVTVTVTTASSPPTLTGLGNPNPTFPEGTQNVSFKLDGAKGSGLLSTLEVRQNGLLVDEADFNWNGLSMMSMGNPFQLTGSDVDGFTEGEFLVDLPMDVGVFVYIFILEDEFGSRDTASYTVVTESSGTPVEIREDEILNRDGMAAGGLDLDTGDNVPSSSELAELIDNGIDINLPANSNWIQTISAVNGATMKYVVASAEGVPEGYSFADTNFKEEIEALYTNNTGTEISEANSNSTAVVEVGDDFVVSSNGNYWLLTVKEVVKTVNNNNDKYILDVKF